MRKNLNGRHTKELIGFAVFSLMHRKSYSEISVKEICEKAGVSRMSFYRYYNKKDDIFIDYCDERFEEFYESFKKKEDINLRDFVLSTFTFIGKYSRQLQILKHAEKQQLLMEQFNSYSKYIVSHLKFPAIRDPKNPTIVPFMAGGFFNILMQWLDNGMEESPEAITDLLFSIFR